MSERDLGTVFAVIAFVLGVTLGALVTRDMYRTDAIKAGVACYGATTGKFMWISSAQEPQVQEEPRNTRKINSNNRNSNIESGSITIKE